MPMARRRSRRDTAGDHMSEDPPRGAERMVGTEPQHLTRVRELGEIEAIRTVVSRTSAPVGITARKHAKALLPALIRCRHCGRKLTLRDSGMKHHIAAVRALLYNGAPPLHWLCRAERRWCNRGGTARRRPAAIAAARTLGSSDEAVSRDVEAARMPPTGLPALRCRCSPRPGWFATGRSLTRWRSRARSPCTMRRRPAHC